MNVAFQRNIGSFIAGAASGTAAATVTAGGANDDTALPGLTVDRNAIAGGKLFLSGALILPFTPTLAASQSVAVSCTFEDSANGSTWAAYDGGPGADGVQTFTVSAAASCAILKCQLGGARRYIRARPKLNMSATGTDTTAVGAGVWIFGGVDELPVT